MSEKSKKYTNICELKKLLDLVDENRRPIAENIFKRLKFVDKTLTDLEKQIKKEGAVITFTNGNGFETVSEHPAQKSYNTMLGRYNALVKTFLDIIPEGQKSTDDFLEFVSRVSK